MDLSHGEILKNARERKGISFNDMAKLLGTSLEQVKAWEDESEIVKTEDIMIVSRAYELAMMEMIFYLENIKVNSLIPYRKSGASFDIN